MRQLEEFADRMDEIRRPAAARSATIWRKKDERANLRRELRDLMRMTQESPRSLRKRCASVPANSRTTSR
jgi:RNA polymerase primary sigma factor